MLQAMNTGHEGSMTTIHANNPRDALRRLENMVSMAGMNFPIKAIREQISSALNLLVQVAVWSAEDEKSSVSPRSPGWKARQFASMTSFRFQQQGVDKDGYAYGRFESCGVRPRLVDKLLAQGIEISDRSFPATRSGNSFR